MGNREREFYFEYKEDTNEYGQLSDYRPKITDKSFEIVHVIEYSAYDQSQKRVEELEGELGKPYDKVDMLFETNKSLMAENKKLRETLSKFSDPNFYWTKPPTVEDGWIVYGRAKKTAELLNAARQALGGAGNELQASKESP